MDSYCGHTITVDCEDEQLLLDDENTNVNKKCIQCSKRKNKGNGDINTNTNVEGVEWILNSSEVVSENVINERLSINSEHIESPEDSPLLNTERYNEFGNLSIGEFHCHSNFKYTEDNRALKKLITVSLLCFLFMITELVGGYIAGSLAVMTDAAHLFSDLIGFLISILSIFIGKKTPTRRMTFGYHRAEILGAFLSVLVIWIMAGTFFVLAVNRLIEGIYDINVDTMLLIASLGLVINIIMGGVLHGMCHTHSHALGTAHNDENINVRAATAHIIGDILQSVGVLFAAAIIKISPSAKDADPICTILFSIVVVFTTLKVAKDSFLILLEASPVDVGDIIFLLRNIYGVKHVHSVRLWTLTPGKEIFAAHLAVDEYCDRDVVLNQATHLINNRLKVLSCHIQIEAFDDQIINSCMQCQELQC